MENTRCSVLGDVSARSSQAVAEISNARIAA